MREQNSKDNIGLTTDRYYSEFRLWFKSFSQQKRITVYSVLESTGSVLVDVSKISIMMLQLSRLEELFLIRQFFD